MPRQGDEKLLDSIITCTTPKSNLLINPTKSCYIVFEHFNTVAYSPHFSVTAMSLPRMGKAIGFVCCLSARKSPDLEMLASERHVNTMNWSKLAKNWLQYALIPLASPMSVTNSVFSWSRLLTLPTSGFCSCAQLA